MATTITANTLTAGDTLIGAVEGEILIVNLVLDTPHNPAGYVDALIYHPTPIDGTTSHWETFELNDQVRIA